MAYNEPHKSNQLPKILAAAAGLVVISVGGLAIKNAAGKNGGGADQSLSAANHTATPVPTISANGTVTAVPTTSSRTALAYKDGTYTADGSYNTPTSTEVISVTLTIKNDVITDSSITNNPQARESQQYQSKFISGYKSLVVGKKISEVNLGRVSGSSLTPIGFNTALAKIKSQAKA